MQEPSQRERFATTSRPRLTIKMCGPNIMIRPTGDTDRLDTAAIAAAVNAATDTGAVMLIDPERVRCSDDDAAEMMTTGPTLCEEHDRCHVARVEPLSSGIVRIRATNSVWTIDVRTGRLCRTAGDVNVRFLHSEDWLPIVAVFVLPDRVIALSDDGVRITAHRAHRTGSTELETRATSR